MTKRQSIAVGWLARLLRSADISGKLDLLAGELVRLTPKSKLLEPGDEKRKAA
jgi:hypothetical protein